MPFKRPRASWRFTGLFVGFLALGCSSSKPTPEKVCKKVFALLHAPEKNQDACIKDLQKILLEKPEVFQCFATCIDRAKTDLDLRICEMNCNDLGGERDETGRRKAYSAPSSR